MKSLPNRFAAINIDNGTVVNFEKQSDGMFKAEWDDGYNGGKHIQFYDESTIKAWLNTYLKMACVHEEPTSLIDKIKTFTRKTKTCVSIVDGRYEICTVGSNATVGAVTDVELEALMGAISLIKSKINKEE